MLAPLAAPRHRALLWVLTGHRCGSRFKSHALPQFGGVIHRTVGDYVLHVARIAYVVERIAVDQDQVCTFSFFHGTGVLSEAHHASGHESRSLYGLHRGEARLYVQLNFAMQTVSGHSLIGASYDRHSGAMECADNGDAFLEEFFPDFGVLGGRANVRELLR